MYTIIQSARKHNYGNVRLVSLTEDFGLFQRQRQANVIFFGLIFDKKKSYKVQISIAMQIELVAGFFEKKKKREDGAK